MKVTVDLSVKPFSSHTGPLSDRARRLIDPLSDCVLLTGFKVGQPAFNPVERFIWAVTYALALYTYVATVHL